MPGAGVFGRRCVRRSRDRRGRGGDGRPRNAHGHATRRGVGRILFRSGGRSRLGLGDLVGVESARHAVGRCAPGHGRHRGWRGRLHDHRRACREGDPAAALHARRHLVVRRRCEWLAQRHHGGGPCRGDVRARGADVGDGSAIVRPIPGRAECRVRTERGGIRSPVHGRHRARPRREPVVGRGPTRRPGRSRSTLVGGRSCRRAAYRGAHADPDRALRRRDLGTIRARGRPGGRVGGVRPARAGTGSSRPRRGRPATGRWDRRGPSTAFAHVRSHTSWRGDRPRRGRLEPVPARAGRTSDRASPIGGAAAGTFSSSTRAAPPVTDVHTSGV